MSEQTGNQTGTENLENNKKNENYNQAHYVFKIIFREIRAEFVGAMVVIGDTANPGFDSVHVVMDKNLDFNIHEEWNSFLEQVKKRRKKVDDASSNFLIFIKKIENYFYKSFSPAKIDKINKTIITTPDKMLRNVLIKNIIEPEVSSLIAHGFEIELELKDEIDFYSDGKESNTDESTETGLFEDGDGKNTGEFILDVMPMIDPNDGIIASTINPGERIFIRITDDSVIGKHISRSITKSDIPEEVPVRTPVIDKKKNVISKFRASSEVIELKVKLDEGVFGKLIVQTGVKLRTKLEEEKNTEDKNADIRELSSEDEDGGFQGNPISYFITICFLILTLYTIIRFLR